MAIPESPVPCVGYIVGFPGVGVGESSAGGGSGGGGGGSGKKLYISYLMLQLTL